MKEKLILDLEKRGILKDITNKNKFINLQKNEAIYAGFDPTAISLHLGNYIQISVLLRLKRYGVKVIALVGGATGMIGDPSFNLSERKLLDFDEIEKNKNSIKNQLSSFGIEVFDNYEIYKNMNVLEFLRTIGKNLNVNYMISKDSVADRLETGLSFTEFSYQLIQGWDFKYLYENFNVIGQLGGSDQWGNITSGIEIIRKNIGDQHKAFGITTNLLTDKNNKKFGKSTGGGSLWLNKNLTSPFQMYQFLLSQDDEVVERLLKYLTFIEIEEIENIINKHQLKKSDKIAQKTLAFEVVKDIHGVEEANNAVKITNILFNKGDLEQLTIENIQQLKNSIPFIKIDKIENASQLLLDSKIISSKRELREFLAQCSISINGSVIKNEQDSVDTNKFENKFILVKKGKKNYFVLEIKKEEK
ncbi:tyrosine--tRNA ligase [Mesomycoplasma molare]|uniref:Tyrosine--tRNA ligase n=1 Tax=Mesomycoplasma molare TaxID=171288 RepID=A0ABY5TY37_9BACT|nr:tyrosine--tRNA ligase [Mesomycoplasma molare]UWD33954.1 tyrosine--tRNA ligase [Mesomycoplasma molare]